MIQYPGTYPAPGASDPAQLQAVASPSDPQETYTFSGSAAPSGTLVEVLDESTVLASTVESGGTWSTSFDEEPEQLPASVTVRASADGFVTEEQTVSLDPQQTSYTGINFALNEEPQPEPFPALTELQIDDRTHQSAKVIWSDEPDFGVDLELEKLNGSWSLVLEQRVTNKELLEFVFSELEAGTEYRARYRWIQEEEEEPLDPPTLTGLSWEPEETYAGQTPTVTPEGLQDGGQVITEISIVWEGTEVPVGPSATAPPWDVTFEEELEIGTLFLDVLITTEEASEPYRIGPFEREVEAPPPTAPVYELELLDFEGDPEGTHTAPVYELELQDPEPEEGTHTAPVYELELQE